MKYLWLLISIIAAAVYGEGLIRIENEQLPLLYEYIKTPDIAGRPDSRHWDIHIYDSNLINLGNIRYGHVQYTMNKAQHHTLQQAYDYMDSIHGMYPSITDLDTLGYTAQYNYPLVILKINGSSPAMQNTRSGFLLMAMHHAREWQTVGAALFFADSLLCNYGSDSSITALIDSTFIVVYPVVNPDGYHYSRDLGNNMWRKNRSYRKGYYGVDLNRNYGGGVNANAGSEWGFIGNGFASHNPPHDMYCGPYANSEREVQSVLQLIEDYDFDISISLHSYGQMVIWPWGSIHDLPPDSTALKYIGNEMAAVMVKKGSNAQYDAFQSVDLYPSTGDSDDWIYGYSKFIKGNTVLPFTFEIDNTFNSTTAADLDTLYRNVFNGIVRGLELISYAGNYHSEMPLKPVLALDNDTLSWSCNNIEDAAFFTIMRKLSPSVKTDSVNDEALYSMRHFYRTDLWYNSQAYSFKDSSADALSPILAYRNKTLIGESDSLSFSIWYSMEDNYDKAFVELSREGYLWFPADTACASFTGSSDGWKDIAYDMSFYAGEFLYSRIRSVYDNNVLFEGVYIDDINPLTVFEYDSVYAESLSVFALLMEPDDYYSEYFTVTPFTQNWGYTQESDRMEVNTFSFRGRDVDSTTTLADIHFNPLDRTVFIEFYAPAENAISIGIYNILGECVYTYTVSDDAYLDLGDLQTGRYYLYVKNDSRIRKGLLIIR